jgi:hypothetical protein
MRYKISNNKTYYNKKEVEDLILKLKKTQKAFIRNIK